MRSSSTGDRSSTADEWGQPLSLVKELYLAARYRERGDSLGTGAAGESDGGGACARKNTGNGPRGPLASGDGPGSEDFV